MCAIVPCCALSVINSTHQILCQHNVSCSPNHILKYADSPVVPLVSLHTPTLTHRSNRTPERATIYLTPLVAVTALPLPSRSPRANYDNPDTDAIVSSNTRAIVTPIHSEHRIITRSSLDAAVIVLPTHICLADRTT